MIGILTKASIPNEKNENTRLLQMTELTLTLNGSGKLHGASAAVQKLEPFPLSKVEKGIA